MAELRPIKPLLYNPDRVPNLSGVITPPYDVISPAEQQMYRERSPYSAIRIELPEERDGLDRYAAAAALIREWRDAGVLVPDEMGGFFVHHQEFELDGEPRARTALLAAVRLEPWEAGVVLPHELTHRGPKQDRLRLLRATATAPSSVFSLYDQPPAVRQALEAATSVEPLYTATESEVIHKLWAVRQPAQVEAISAAMAPRTLYIADGHHRYETALAYRDERRAADGDDPDAAYNYIAMSLVAFDDPGLVVLPTHRVVSGVSPSATDDLSGRLAGLFDLEPIALAEYTEQAVRTALAAVPAGVRYALLLYDGRRVWRVTGGDAAEAALPRDRSAAWRALDLAALHDLVFARALGVAPERAEELIGFTRDVPGAFAAVDAGRAGVAAFVRPTGVEQLRAVADAEDKMPQKSTYFYPKFPAGLVINRLGVRLSAPAEVGA